jgi:hypothetical protein
VFPRIGNLSKVLLQSLELAGALNVSGYVPAGKETVEAAMKWMGKAQDQRHPVAKGCSSVPAGTP